MANAIGILETQGMVALVKGVDAMLKAASVSLAGQYKDVGSAYMSAVCSVHVIARPNENTEAILAPKAASKK